MWNLNSSMAKESVSPNICKSTNPLVSLFKAADLLSHCSNSTYTTQRVVIRWGHNSQSITHSVPLQYSGSVLMKQNQWTGVTNDRQLPEAVSWSPTWPNLLWSKCRCMSQTKKILKQCFHKSGGRVWSTAKTSCTSFNLNTFAVFSEVI